MGNLHLILEENYLVKIQNGKQIIPIFLILSAFFIIGCDDDSSTTAPVSCSDLQAQMDTALYAFMAGSTGADAATLCQTALTAVTALKDNSCNASTTMLDDDGVTWIVNAEDVAEIQAGCDEVSGG